MFDRRNRLSDQVSDDVREVLGPVVFETVIPRNVRLSEAPSHGLPALIYDHRCAGSAAYIALARELIDRLPNVRKAASMTDNKEESGARTEERRVGKEGVSTCSTPWLSYKSKTKKQKN